VYTQPLEDVWHHFRAIEGGRSNLNIKGRQGQLFDLECPSSMYGFVNAPPMFQLALCVFLIKGADAITAILDDSSLYLHRRVNGLGQVIIVMPGANLGFVPGSLSAAEASAALHCPSTAINQVMNRLGLPGKRAGLFDHRLHPPSRVFSQVMSVGKQDLPASPPTSRASWRGPHRQDCRLDPLERPRRQENRPQRSGSLIPLRMQRPLPQPSCGLSFEARSEAVSSHASGIVFPRTSLAMSSFPHSPTSSQCVPALVFSRAFLFVPFGCRSSFSMSTRTCSTHTHTH